MFKKFIVIAGLAVAGFLFADSAEAQISGVYVQAENEVNTFLSSDGVTSMASPAGGDGRWRDSTNQSFAMEGGFAYEPITGSSEEIVTTITGLEEGQSYEINVVFGNFNFNSAGLQAGFTSGELMSFPNLTPASPGVTDTGIEVVAGFVRIAVLELGLGTTTADEDGEIDVFLGERPEGTTNRYLYYGVASTLVDTSVLLGDVNLDSVVDFLDISPFIGQLSSGGTQAEADCNQDGAVDFLDISVFISILSGS